MKGIDAVRDNYYSCIVIIVILIKYLNSLHTMESIGGKSLPFWGQFYYRPPPALIRKSPTNYVRVFYTLGEKCHPYRSLFLILLYS